MNELLPISRRHAHDTSSSGAQMVARVRRNRTGRCLLAVALGCLALLVSAPVAAATGYGSVSGKVTGAVSKTGLEGVEVRLYSSEDTYYPATTTSTGTYSAAVEAGEYKVEFIGGGAGYATQYYKDKLSYAAATALDVSAEANVKEVNASLYKSGSISGERHHQTGSRRYRRYGL